MVFTDREWRQASRRRYRRPPLYWSTKYAPIVQHSLSDHAGVSLSSAEDPLTAQARLRSTRGLWDMNCAPRLQASLTLRRL